MLDRSFEMEMNWGARVETPFDLAKSFVATVDAIAPLHPVFNSWTWGDQPEVWETEGEGGAYPFAEIRKKLVPAIERNANTGGEGSPDPFHGYLMAIVNDTTPPEIEASLSVSAGEGINGGSWVTAFVNRADFGIGPNPDPALISFDLFRAVFLILSETWRATWGWAASGDFPHQGDGRPVRAAWMSYVSPHFAPLMTPPPSAIVERRPNGGLFLAATRDVFEKANPAHLAVAREIEAALQPLNRIPNPNDAPYR